jgi:hypothetical protein
VTATVVSIDRKRRGKAAAGEPQQARPRLDPDSLEHFAEFCRRFIVLDNGKPFELEPFQRTIVASYFAGVTEVLVLLPKKNGKTTLMAALALHHLIYRSDVECYIAASAEKQAKILYRQARGFIERKGPDGELVPQAAALQTKVVVKPGFLEIRSLRDGGFIQVLAGTAKFEDGLIPTLAIVDELHRHTDGGALYGVLADGLGARDGRLVSISTAGESMRSPLGRARARALKFPGVTRDGAYVHSRSPAGDFEMHEWSLRSSDNREDLQLVKTANPLEANTVRKLEIRKGSPFMTPSRWARFGAGVWMQGDDAAYSSVDWENHANPDLLVPKPGTAGYLGLDIGWRWDSTAIVFGEPWDVEWVEIDGESGWWRWTKLRLAKPKVLRPPRNGNSLPRKDIIDAVLYFKNELGLEILGVVFDRNAEGESVAQEIENDHGLEVIDHSQKGEVMAAASMGFGEALGQGRIEQPDDDEFTAHILACKTQTVSGELWKIAHPERDRGKRKRGQQDGEDTELIDAGQAAVMLHRVATALHEPDQEPLIAWR